MTKYYAIVLLILFLSCEKKDSIRLQENYILTEKRISDDCNAFQMRFKKGKYILKYSLAGSCKELTTEVYIREYILYLQNNYDSLAHQKGYVICDYYGLGDSNTLRDSIIKITKRKFNKEVILKQVGKNTFTMEIFDKR